MGESPKTLTIFCKAASVRVSKRKGMPLGCRHARGPIKRIRYREIRYSDLLITFLPQHEDSFLTDRVETVPCFALVP